MVQLYYTYHMNTSHFHWSLMVKILDYCRAHIEEQVWIVMRYTTYCCPRRVGPRSHAVSCSQKGKICPVICTYSMICLIAAQPPNHTSKERMPTACSKIKCFTCYSGTFIMCLTLFWITIFLCTDSNNKLGTLRSVQERGVLSYGPQTRSL